MSATHTCVELKVSREAYDEIRAKLALAGYEHAFVGSLIDMDGIALKRGQRHVRVARLERAVRQLREALMELKVAHINRKVKLPVALHGLVCNTLSKT